MFFQIIKQISSYFGVSDEKISINKLRRCDWTKEYLDQRNLNLGKCKINKHRREIILEGRISVPILSLVCKAKLLSEENSTNKIGVPKFLHIASTCVYNLPLWKEENKSEILFLSTTMLGVRI